MVGTQPLQFLQSSESTMLLGLSLIITLLVAGKAARGLHLDAYPGYGQLWLRLRGLNDDIFHEEESYRRDISEYLDDALREIENISEAQQRVLTDCEEILLCGQEEMENVNAARQEWRTTCEQLHKIYQAEYTRVKDAPHPSHFESGQCQFTATPYKHGKNSTAISASTQQPWSHADDDMSAIKAKRSKIFAKEKTVRETCNDIVNAALARAFPKDLDVAPIPPRKDTQPDKMATDAGNPSPRDCQSEDESVIRLPTTKKD